MSEEILVNKLHAMGKTDFAPGEFLGADFDQISKVKVNRYTWSVLLKSLPVLDKAALDTWNQTYQHLAKKARAGFISSGKYFVLILTVDMISADVLQQLSQDGKLDFLEMSRDITRGGGYVLLLVKDRKQIFMPKQVNIPSVLKATEWHKQLFTVLDAYKNSLTGGGKALYAVLWAGEQLPKDKVVPTLGVGLKEFTADNAEFKTLFDAAVATRADIHVLPLAVPALMRSEAGMMDQFYGFLKSKSVSETPSLNDDVYKIEFKDEAGKDALAWVCFL